MNSHAKHGNQRAWEPVKYNSEYGYPTLIRWGPTPSLYEYENGYNFGFQISNFRPLD